MVLVDIGHGVAVEIWIEVEGQALRNLKLTESPAERTQRCFVVSSENKAFGVRYQNANPGRVLSSVRLSVYLDGVWVAAKSMSPGGVNGGIIDQTVISSHESRPFLFAPLRLTDDEDIALVDITSMEDLGIIRVDVDHVIVGGSEPVRAREVPLPGESLIHEKSKKMGTHATVLGPTITRVTNFTKVTSRKLPVHSVKFQYAPAEYLRAREILPPILQPAPSPIATLPWGPADAKVKQEVKKELSPTRTNLKRPLVIDLTSDDDEVPSAADREAYERVKKHLASINKKPKLEPSTSTAIDLSDD